MKAGRLLLALGAGLLLAGCEGRQSALAPAGDLARAIAAIYHVFLIVSAGIWLLVVLFLAIALVRRKQRRNDPLDVDPREERRFTIVITSLVGLTCITLIVLTAVSYAGQKILFAPGPNGVTIRIVGHQFWWEVHYEDSDAARSFVTANEIHLPVGELVELKLDASDVIHSFWLPNLAGKEDLIPGRQNILRVKAEREGVYRGQCAEFCGYQHAHMGMVVFAEPRDKFDAWRAAQVAPREPPRDDLRRRGEQVFLGTACVMCHTVRGTPAASTIGPDLTHVGGRSTIAAALLPTNIGSLAAWITDPQSAKPGSKMPDADLESAEVLALAAYLEGLK